MRFLLLPLLAACSADTKLDGALADLIDRVLEPSGLTEDQVVVHAVSETEDSTLFLVDTDPDAGWSHPVTWVTMHADGGVDTEEHIAAPEVDGVAFVPEHHPPVWGADFEWYDHEDFDEEHELALWDLGEGSRRAADPQDRCNPKKPKTAVTLAGGRILSSRQDEVNWRRLLQARGYAVTWETPMPDDQIVTRDEALAAIRTAVGTEELSELVLFWGGHGLPDGGTLAMGETTVTDRLTQADLVAALEDAKVDKLVVILASCHSGQLADSLPGALKAAGMEHTEVIVHAATRGAEPAWVERRRPWGSAFGRRLHQAVAATPAAKDIDWNEITVEPVTVQTSIGEKSQTPVKGRLERVIPKITVSSHPFTEVCYAGWLDQNDPDFDPSRDYGRGAMISGLGFGSATGSVEMQQMDGDWVRVPHTFWSDEGISLNLPMRRDGFPANRWSEWPSEERTRGEYRVRIVSAEGRESEPRHVKFDYQVYEQIWTSSGPNTPWMEMWFPLTPDSLSTNGPTVQLSQTWNASTGTSPIPPGGEIWDLDADQDQQHVTAPGVGGPVGWSYEIPPSIRGATAYDQSFPDFRYWGFRARFALDDNLSDPWGFTLIYD